MFVVFGLGLRGVPQTRSESSNLIPWKKREHAGGSDALKGMVCHGGGDHIFVCIRRVHWRLCGTSIGQGYGGSWKGGVSIQLKE